jgi:hypothetical protein
MRSSHLPVRVCLVLLPLLAACAAADPAGEGDATESAFSSAASCKPSGEDGRVDKASFVTKTGAKLAISVSHSLPDNSNCGASGGLVVEYDDAAGFFGSAQDLRAPITLHAHTNEKQSASARTISLGRTSGTKFVGVFCGLGSKDFLDVAEIAVSDLAGHRWESNDSRNYVQPFANERFSANLTSSLGAAISVDLIADWPTGASCASSGFFVSYDDKTQFFGGAANIHAVARLHRHAGGAKDVRQVDVSLSKGATGSYQGLSCGSLAGDEVLDGIELAFSNAAKTKWDSNASKNYAVSCSF